MAPIDPQPDTPALATYEDLARLIDHTLVEPHLNDDHVGRACDLAREYGVASVLVRPCDVDLAVRWLGSSGVAVGAVVGYPHGHSTTAAKLYEGRDLLRRGAKELEVVVPLSKLTSRQFMHVESELSQFGESCRQSGALLKVVLETGYLAPDLKLIALKCCKRAGADFAVTGTEYGPTPALLDDIRYLKEHLGFRLQLKAAGQVTTLDQALAFHAAGCTRLGTGATAPILDAWKAELARRAPAPAT